MIQLEALLPIEDLSKQLGLNKYTIYQKIRKNKFPKGVKLNGRRLFKTGKSTQIDPLTPA